MSGNAEQLFKRAFSGFQSVAKRDPKASGVVEIDLGKIATGIGKAAVSSGLVGDVEDLEKVLAQFGELLEKAEHDPASDAFFAPATEFAKRFEIEKAAELPTTFTAPPEQPGEAYTGGGSARSKPPAKGSKEHKAQTYTAGSGLANDDGEQYTESATETSGKGSGGKPGTSFDQPSGGPNATAKARRPAADSRPVGAPAAALAAEGEDGKDGLVSDGAEGLAMQRRAAKAAAVRKAAAGRPASTEELWARDMSEMTTEEVREVRKAAKKSMADQDAADEKDEEVDHGQEGDDRTAAEAKGKKAKAAAKKAQGSDPTQTVDELSEDDREAEARRAVKPNASDVSDSVDEVGKGAACPSGDPHQSVDDPEDEPEKSAAKKGKPFPGAAKPFGAKGKPDDDEEKKKAAKAKAAKKPPEGSDEEEASESDEEAAAEGDTKKADDTTWERDLSPEPEAMVRKSARMTDRERPLSMREGTRDGAQGMAKVRKAAMAQAVVEESDVDGEEVPGSGLTPDQVRALAKSDKLSPLQKQRRRVATLKARGYQQGDAATDFDPSQVQD